MKAAARLLGLQQARLNPEDRHLHSGVTHGKNVSVRQQDRACREAPRGNWTFCTDGREKCGSELQTVSGSS